MQNLPPDLLPRLTQLLMPHLNEEERDAWLTQAFYLTESRLYHQIDMSGSSIVFTTKCLKTLFKFECLPSGIHSVSALLGAIKLGVGAGQQAEFDSLMKVVDTLCQPEKAEPEHSDPLPPVQQEPQTVQTPRTERTPTLFISYSSADRDSAMKLVADLQKAGHACWIDNSKIKGGDEWIRSIGEGLTNSYAMITLVSEKANKSRWVEREFIWADNNKRPIFPVWLEDCVLPWYMGNLQGTPLYDDYDANLQDLLASLPRPVIAQPDDEPIVLTERVVNPRELELEYLNRVLLEHNVWQAVYTPMAGVATIRQQPNKKTIKRATAGITPIYSLRDKMRDEVTPEAPTRQKEFSDITEAVNEVKQLVVLGDPGAGKTTTLWKLAADYAQLAVDDPKRPLPVFLRLGGLDYGTTVQEAIQAQLGDISLDRLLEEKRVAMLIDGLNELPDDGGQADKIEELRELVKQAQDDDHIVVVTCRELDYIPDVDLNIQEQVNITPLDPNRIREFCHRHLPDDGETLFWALSGGETVRQTWHKWMKAGATFDLFWQADSIPRENPDVYTYTRGEDDQIWKDALSNRTMLQLARNPYMLFMMTEVFAENEGELPPNRGKLFDLFTDYLLQEREGLPETESDALQNKLAEYAYTMQVQGLGTITGKDIARQHLSDEQLYQAVSANLLEDRGDVRFTHQLLQEYFAARRLDVERQNGLSAGELWSADDWWIPNDWNETAILLTGLYNDDATEIILWLADANPALTARCINESGANVPDATLLRLRDKWLSRLTNLNSEPKSRDIVGRVLSVALSTGEPLDIRPGINVNQDGLPDFMWCDIPESVFIMGSNLDNDSEAHVDETPQHNKDISGFYMSKYLVTNAQYRTFVTAKGYDHRAYWTDSGWDQRITENWTVPRYWHDSTFNLSNQPVVGVSWYEAVAYTNWLNEIMLQELIQKLSLQGKWKIRLARESEWEKAAKGPNMLIYPYGNDFNPNKANVSHTGIGRPSVVGLFTHGASSYGLLDLSGNVWEWCLTKWRSNYEQPEDNVVDGISRRVIRGGAFYHDPQFSRSAHRSYNDPVVRNIHYGFRIVLSSHDTTI